MLDGFMLGAVMKQDPLLEEFGALPEELPNEDPCWDSKTKGEPCPEQEPKKPRAHPVRSQKPTNPVIASVRHNEIPPPYLLQWFNWDLMFASHRHGMQSIKE